MNRIFQSSFRVLLAICLAGTASTSVSEGLPVPWPFPWAKECPVDWQSLQGRYELANSLLGEQISLRVSLFTLGNKLVQVSRYSGAGELMSQGFVWIGEAEKAMSLELLPEIPEDRPIIAVFKLYHNSLNSDCGQEQLVPIVTYAKTRNPRGKKTQFRLMRVSGS